MHTFRTGALVIAMAVLSCACGVVSSGSAPSIRERALEAVADPNVALLVLVVGALGIYLEFLAPGLVVPGLAGTILGLFALTALSRFPIDWRGAGLIVLGMVLFVLEAKFISHGILTAGGAIVLTLGAAMLIGTNAAGLRIRWSTAVGLALPFALITSFLFSIAMRARRNKAVTGAEGLLGAQATVVGELNPTGIVLVRGEYWSARASLRVPASEPVRITGIAGLTLRVEPVAGPLTRKLTHKES